MIEFPKMLYRGPDALACLLDAATVVDADSEAAARADGFRLYAEIAAGVPAVQATAPDYDDKATLLARAEALGIDADGRWSVKRLKSAIEAKG